MGSPRSGGTEPAGKAHAQSDFQRETCGPVQPIQGCKKVRVSVNACYAHVCVCVCVAHIPSIVAVLQHHHATLRRHTHTFDETHAPNPTGQMHVGIRRQKQSTFQSDNIRNLPLVFLRFQQEIANAHSGIDCLRPHRHVVVPTCRVNKLLSFLIETPEKSGANFTVFLLRFRG
jgi:hypothetical protein